MRVKMNQADAGDNLVRPSLQSRQHAARVCEVDRFAHDFVIEKDEGVRAEHERVRMFFGDDARLTMRVELAEFPRRQMFVRHFRHIAGDDLKIQFQLPQQFRAAR